MPPKRLHPLLFVLAVSSLAAEPLLSSWHTLNSGQYARIYETTADQTALNAVTTWSHPTNGTGQALPTYAGVHEITYTTSDVYIRTSGLGFHIMGPWYLNAAKTNIFPNYPANSSAIFRFPRVPGTPPISKTPTGNGTIGYFVDGIGMFDSRDAFSYSNSNTADASPGTAFNGDGIWNRDAYINESVTFDPANAHQAGINHHYHANPPALRHLIGGSVDYDASTNTYTENFNGQHSPIIGWVRDGYPLYGPYGYHAPDDPTSSVRRMISGYTDRDGSNGTTNLNDTGRTSLPSWAAAVQGINATLTASQYGSTINATYPLGHYIEDYDYLGNLGFTLNTDFDLDEHNGRFCKTPEYPDGTYAYFVSIDAVGTPKYPYNIGRTFYGSPTGASVNTLPATAQIYFEGGPEATLSIDSLEVEPTAGDVTLTWSGPEGGTYLIEHSADLDEWKILDDTAENEFGTLGSGPDATRTLDEASQFYRASLTTIKPFDDEGFDYDLIAFPKFTASFSPLPPLGEINSVSVSGVTATIIEYDAVAGTLTLDFDENTLTPSASYAAQLNYTPTAGSPTVIASTNTHTVAALHNILLLIVDDWAIDSSPVDNSTALNPGTSYPPMPNLETLAARGLRFTNAYAQPVCSPTRATILTGRHAFRHTVGWPEGATLPATELTLPEIFTAESSSYHLASFGKWHLGGGSTGPLDLGGWPEFAGIIGGAVNSYTDWSKTVNGVTTSNVTTYTTTDQVNEAVSFISAQTTDPWFVWIGFNAPHTPFHNPPTVVPTLEDYPDYPTTDGAVTGANRRLAYEAALQALDTEIGRLLASVDLNNTNIIIIGDNGTPSAVVQSPFDSAHAKGSLYDGGIHVPLIMAGPDVTLTGISHKLVHCVDLFATILDLARIDIDTATTSVDTIDSQSIVPILNGQDCATRYIVSEVFGSGSTGDGRTIISSDYPDYKLIIFGDPTTTSDIPTYEMYDLSQDENEQNPLGMPVLGDAHYNAYQALLAKDLELSPTVETGDTLYLHLEETTGPSSVPQNESLAPTSIEVDGVTATYIDRVDQTDIGNRYWVKCTLPDTTSPPYTTATVTFTNVPMGDATRAFVATEIIVAP
ncbi:MAG: arylsulfatase A-like enzyme [Lentimonas sp.]|jgi:arylsulfatase A-like enzyme